MFGFFFQAVMGIIAALVAAAIIAAIIAALGFGGLVLMYL